MLAENSLLSVKDLHCRYNHEEILSNISFDVLENDFLAIMGPNGAGKTTLLRALTLSIRHVVGDLQYEGRNLRKFSRRRIAQSFSVLPQNIQTPFAYSVEEILNMARYPHKSRFSPLTSQDKMVIAKIAEKTDVIRFFKRKVSQLSAGERQRVFLAQALIQEPKILFLDEPISHLDLAHQIEIFRLLKEVNTEGIAIVAIFHDLTFAFHFAKHVLLLNSGKVYAYGRPKSVLTESNIHEVFATNLRLIPQPDTDIPLLKYDL
jgi:iron complex transport system ATP-binding protein